MNSIRYIPLTCAVLLTTLALDPAHAGTLPEGRTITTAFYFPNQSTIGFGGVPVESPVGPGVEIAGSPQGFPITSIDFADTSITLDFFANLNGTVAPFNGWRFYDANNTLPAFTSAVLTMTNTTGWSLSFDADNIWLNGSGSSYFDTSGLRIDVTAVPLPASGLLFASGLLGVLGGCRLKSRAALR